MLDFYDAQQQLLAAIAPSTRTQTCSLTDAVGLVLAQPLLAQYDAPQFDNSAMDGYALCDPDANTVTFTVVGRIAAGEHSQERLQAGQAVRIFTGAPVPPGTTSVVPQEKVQVQADGIVLQQPERAGANIRYKAEEYAAGGILLPQGQLLDAAAIALAASQGHAQVTVYAPLKVAVFSSGDELTEPGEPLQAGRIYDANRFQLQAWMQGLPVQVVINDCLPDDLAITRERLQQAAAQADVIITSGGVSVGEEDHIRNALTEIGEVHLWKLAIKPGKPFGWGKAGNAHVFMLPGNPVATFVTFFMLALPAMRKLMGQSQCAPAALRAQAAFSRSKLETRREFLRGTLQVNAQGVWQVQVPQGQGSHMLAACVQANVLVEVAPNTAVAEGDTVPVFLLPNKGWL